MLNTIRHPALTPTDLPPILIAHGLYGSARNWNVIARRLSEKRDVLAVDMRNHGESPWFDSHSYADLAGDLAQVIASHGGQADVIGHSMGGKASMMLALTHPGAVRRLVVADIAPVAYQHDQTQYIQAMRAMDLAGLSARAEADRRLALTVPEAPLRAFFLQSLDLKAEGGPRWRLNFDTLAAEMPRIVGWPDPQGQFDGPTLFLTGSESGYVRPENRPVIRALFPNAHFAKLAGAGHWLHADRPREFEESLRVFLGA